VLFIFSYFLLAKVSTSTQTISASLSGSEYLIKHTHWHVMLFFLTGLVHALQGINLLFMDLMRDEAFSNVCININMWIS
jgi:hypothetical protein